MTDTGGGARSARRVIVYVVGLGLIVTALVGPVVRASQSPQPLPWWQTAIWFALIPLGAELSFAPALRAWVVRNRARIASRDAERFPWMADAGAPTHRPESIDPLTGERHS